MKTFTHKVDGTPVPQPRIRVSTRGGFARAYVPQKHPVHAWRKLVADSVQEALVEAEQEGAFNGVPLSIHFAFLLPRVKSHFRANIIGNELKPSAPDRPISQRSGDASNYLKAVEDALNGVLYLDDSWIVDVRATKKYADYQLEETPGVVVQLMVMP